MITKIMDLNTCAMCGTPLETRHKCYHCGNVVCRQHITMMRGVYACARCVERMNKPHPIHRKEGEVDLGIGRI